MNGTFIHGRRFGWNEDCKTLSLIPTNSKGVFSSE